MAPQADAYRWRLPQCGCSLLWHHIFPNLLFLLRPFCQHPSPNEQPKLTPCERRVAALQTSQRGRHSREANRRQGWRCWRHGKTASRRRRRGDHAFACTRTGLLARRAKLVEQAWLAVCREAVGAEGHVVPQQWLSHTSAPGVPTSDRRRLAPGPRPFVAMPRWLAPSPERVPLTHERTILPASPCAWPRAASAQRIRNCSAAAASASSSLLWRSEGAGTPIRRRLSDSCRLQCLDA